MIERCRTVGFWLLATLATIAILSACAGAGAGGGGSTEGNPAATLTISGATNVSDGENQERLVFRFEVPESAVGAGVALSSARRSVRTASGAPDPIPISGRMRNDEGNFLLTFTGVFYPATQTFQFTATGTTGSGEEIEATIGSAYSEDPGNQFSNVTVRYTVAPTSGPPVVFTATDIEVTTEDPNEPAAGSSDPPTEAPAPTPAFYEGGWRFVYIDAAADVSTDATFIFGRRSYAATFVDTDGGVTEVGTDSGVAVEDQGFGSDTVTFVYQDVGADDEMTQVTLQRDGAGVNLILMQFDPEFCGDSGSFPPDVFESIYDDGPGNYLVPASADGTTAQHDCNGDGDVADDGEQAIISFSDPIPLTPIGQTPTPITPPMTPIVFVGYSGGSAWRNEAVSESIDVDVDDVVVDVAFDTEGGDTHQDIVDFIESNQFAVASVSYDKIASTDMTGTLLLSIDGFGPTVANIRSNDYPAQFPLYFAYTTPQSGFAADFIEYALSSAGQTIIENEGFVGVGSSGSYTPSTISGSGYLVGGSSTVAAFAPEMIVAYEVARSDTATIDGAYDSIGSGAGANRLGDGTLDLAGMSRDLRTSERTGLPALDNTQVGHSPFVFIVNDSAPISDVTITQLRNILSDTISNWEDLN